MEMISSDSSSRQRHYHPPLFDFNEPFISKAPQVLDKILGGESGTFFLVLLKVRYRSPLERRSTSPLQGGDGSLGKLTENLEGEEESNIRVAEDMNAQRKIAVAPPGGRVPTVPCH